MFKSNKSNKSIAAVEVAETGRRGRRALVPLATLAAAGALAVGSGANFVSSSVNPASAVASGTLTQLNSKANAAIFNVTNIKPGDTVQGDVTITNTGSLPSMMSISEALAQGQANTFVDPANLQLTVTQTTPSVATPIYSGAFGSLGSINLGRFNSNEARTYRFSVTMKPTADNTEQGKTASYTYTWAGVQTSNVTATDGTAATPVNANP